METTHNTRGNRCNNRKQIRKHRFLFRGSGVKRIRSLAHTRTSISLLFYSISILHFHHSFGPHENLLLPSRQLLTNSAAQEQVARHLHQTLQAVKKSIANYWCDCFEPIECLVICHKTFKLYVSVLVAVICLEEAINCSQKQLSGGFIQPECLLVNWRKRKLPRMNWGKKKQNESNFQNLHLLRHKITDTGGITMTTTSRPAGKSKGRHRSYCNAVQKDQETWGVFAESK